MSASVRYQDLQTNEAAFRSRRHVIKLSTFSSTFSRTWSGYGDWYWVTGIGMETWAEEEEEVVGVEDPEAEQLRVLLTMEAQRRSNLGDRSSSSSDIDCRVRSWCMRFFFRRKNSSKMGFIFIKGFRFSRSEKERYRFGG